ncbi:MAG: hypothetical protein ABWX73_12700 [Marmoricola sp.]
MDEATGEPTVDQPTADETQWPTTCSDCGTTLQRGVIDFDQTNENRIEFNPGEMAAVDFCPNPDCPRNAEAASVEDGAS